MPGTMYDMDDQLQLMRKWTMQHGRLTFMTGYSAFLTVSIYSVMWFVSAHVYVFYIQYFDTVVWRIGRVSHMKKLLQRTERYTLFTALNSVHAYKMIFAVID